MIETANTVQGRLSGIRSRTGAAFLGIPYAAPPVGPLRWRPPQPMSAWSGIRAACHFSPVARQPLPVANSLYFPGDLPQSEDCLTLNVWTNAGSSAERRPVMVWFHLGAFIFGSSRWPGRPGGDPVFDGSHLAELGAVVVTVNYRLNRLGFLAHPWLTAESGHGASGNYGFMDQVAALQWVRDNIAAFGGDPGNVTIFGLSAGSASCSLHIASPLSRGLFNRAIASSGGFMAPAAKDSGIFDRLLTLGEAEKRGTALTDALEVADLDALRQVPFEDLLTAPVPATPGPWVMEALGGGSFGEGVADTQYPIVDGYALPDSPGAIIAAGRHNDVGLLTGSTLDDDTGLPGIETLGEYEAYIRADMGTIADDALAVYAASDDASAYAASGDLIADRVFGWHNWSMARGLAAKGSKPVFYYDWTQALPIPDTYVERRRGAAHGAEMPYVFGTLDAYDWPWSDADAGLSDILSRYWFNFARSGDPNGEGLPAWPAFRDENGPAMQIAHEPKADMPTRRDRFAILDRYYGR